MEKTNVSKGTKLSVRIRGSGREDFYLKMVDGSNIEVCDPDGHILLSVRCMGKTIGHHISCEGWTLQKVGKDGRAKKITNVVLGMQEADKFISEVV